MSDVLDKRRSLYRIGMALLVVCTGVLATAQSEAPVEELIINVEVNYGYAFRNGSWAPIDVDMQNTLRDVSGVVELRTFSGDEVQSPVYRLPIELAKPSRKHVQFQCFLQYTTHIEVRVLEDGRRVFGYPAKIDVNPIADKDSLALVLDDTESGFGFLYDVLTLNRSDDMRLHRETLMVERLAFLSTYLQSYEMFDTIIMGKTDPDRLGQAQRDVIEQFVRRGGSLAVCLGEHADAYRGTWVEQLLGVTIGSKESINEAQLAQQCFPDNLQTGSVNHRDVIVAALTPNGEDVLQLGTDRTIATRRPLGRGAVYAIAVDTESHALQGCLGYRKLWAEIVDRHDTRPKLNLASAADYAMRELPNVSGVTIHSKEAVLTYLALYFLVAILANWLVFNRLKRRELAWVMLVVFSIGFTAYAMIFGTAGRARTSELEQVEVLHVPIGGGTSTLHALVGVLTARTATYGMTFATQSALIKDSATFSLMQGPNSGTTVRPFQTVQAGQTRVEGLRVGASEMRVMEATSLVHTAGGIDGAVAKRDDGSLHVDLINNTGHKIQLPYLLYKGIPLRLTAGEDGRLTGDFSQQDLRAAMPNQRARQGMAPVPIRATVINRKDASLAEIDFRARLSDFQSIFPDIVFSDPNNPVMYYGGYMMPSTATDEEARLWAEEQGPYVYGWLESAPIGRIQVDQDITPRITTTLMVAEVAMAAESESNSTARGDWK